MKTATISQLKTELLHRSKPELIDLCLSLSKFKKENKELLTYLLFEADYEVGYVESIKTEIDEQFELINTSSYFFIKKSVRKILRMVKKYIRYSKKKETEIELLLHFCFTLQNMTPSIDKNTVLKNIFDRQIVLIKKAINSLHEDLQLDYNLALEELM